MVFYIYIRTNIENIYKLGCTNNLYNRENTYITSEFTKQQFIKVFKFFDDNKFECEKILQNKLLKYHKYNNSGNEFYDKQIYYIIDEVIKNNFTNYEVINNINKEIFNNKLVSFNKLLNKTINNKLIQISKFKPFDFQIETINKMLNYYKYNKNGILNWICRLGKTPVTLLFLQQFNINNAVVFVSNNILLNQWKNQIIKFTDYEPLIYNDNLNLLNKNKYIIIIHYINSNKLLNYSIKNNIIFDFKIYDEFHHLTSFNYINNNNDVIKKYYKCIQIKSNYSLSLSATLKIIDNNFNSINILSNNDKNIFGNIIDIKTYNDGIQYNRLCKMNILLDEFNNNDLETANNIINILNNAINITVKYMNNNIIKKCIFFVNKTNNIDYCIDYINNTYNIKCFRYDYKNKCDLDKLIEYDKFILFSVYSCGEGIDLPFIDSICISEKMSSNIRITQSLMRPLTYKYNKIANIILPININKDNLLKCNDYIKILNVIYTLNILNINIIQYINCNCLNINKEHIIKLIDNFNKKVSYNEAIELIKNYNKLNNNEINSIISYKLNYMKVSNLLYFNPELFYNNFKWNEYLNISLLPLNNIKHMIYNFCKDNKIKLTLFKKNFKHYYNLCFKDLNLSLCDFLNYYNLKEII